MACLTLWAPLIRRLRVPRSADSIPDGCFARPRTRPFWRWLPGCGDQRDHEANGQIARAVRQVVRGARIDMFRGRMSSPDPFLTRLETAWADGCHNSRALENT